jgi:hypothetical protein
MKITGVDFYAEGRAFFSMHLRAAPLAVLVALGRQRPQNRLIEFEEPRAARAFQLLERPAVQLLEQDRDRGVELTEAEERVMTKPREDPPLHDEHSGFDLRLIARLAHAGRQDRHVVLRRSSGNSG